MMRPMSLDRSSIDLTPPKTRLQGTGISQKQQRVDSFIRRQQSKDREMSTEKLGSEESFAEKFNKFSVRDFQNNTRMNIKNKDYIKQHEKRERMVDYW